MEVQARDAGLVTVVSICGSVDSLTAESLATKLGEQLGMGKTQIVADLSGVDYTSSAGLRALLASMKEARQRGGDFRLAAVQPDVRRVLDLSGFTSILKVYGDVESAVASFA